MTTLDQLAAEYERRKQETDDSAWTDGRRSHVEMFVGTFLVEAERSAALALISALKESVAKAESDLRGVQAQWRLAMNEDKKWSDEFTAACKRADEAEIAASKIVNCEECGGTGEVIDRWVGEHEFHRPIMEPCSACQPLRAQFISGRTK